MKNPAYHKRIIDEILAEKLESKGAVLIRGPKWCGKTTSAEQQAASILYMSQPATRENNMALAKLNPEALLQGATPRLIDEWQIAPSLWDAVRFEVDHRHKRGQFILTGSAVPADKKEKEGNPIVFHSGTGRFAFIDMLPMTLFESGNSTGEVSLGSLFNSPGQISGYTPSTLEDIAYFICRGGWPYAIADDLSRKASLSQATDYVDLVVEEDISRVDGVRRNPQLARMVLRSYARFQGTPTPISMIRKDILGLESTVSEDTLNAYIMALRQIFVIKDLDAWNPNLQSKTAIRTTPTRYFTDPSIATAALRVGPADLMNDLKFFGLVFETLCVRDLRVYAQSLDGDLYHYRDSNGLECDAVVHLRDGRYGLVEIKLGGEKLIDEGAANLSKLESIIDTTRMPSPSFKMILTATGNYAYCRTDGVCVVPVCCLRN